MQHSVYRCVAALAAAASLASLYAQADIQTAVRNFLQAWYVDRKSPEELKSFVASDNAFNQQPPNPVAAAPAGRGPSRARSAPPDPLREFFRGAFPPSKVGERAAPPPKSLSDAIEYPPARVQGARTMPGSIITNEFAIYPAGSQAAKSFLPAKKPTGNDRVAAYLYHLTQAYKGKLYVVVYTAKGSGMLRETAFTYWIQENGAWKISAFMGTNW